MAEQRIVDDAALLPEVIGGAAEVDGGPEDDRNRHEIETRCPVALILKCAVPQFAKTLRASPLLRLALARRHSSMLSSMNSERSTRPISRSACENEFWRE